MNNGVRGARKMNTVHPAMYPKATYGNAATPNVDNVCRRSWSGAAGWVRDCGKPLPIERYPCGFGRDYHGLFADAANRECVAGLGGCNCGGDRLARGAIDRPCGLGQCLIYGSQYDDGDGGAKRER
jgi:hypothetical protein